MVVCGDAMRHYKDATIYDAIHYYEVMVQWGAHFLKRIRNEAVKRGRQDTAKFADLMRDYDLKHSNGHTFEAMLDYSGRLMSAVIAAEGYGRAIGLFLSERSSPTIPFDLASPEV